MAAVPVKILHSSTLPLPEIPGPSIKAQQRRIVRNVIIVSISFLLLFTSFNSIANLQSSLHPTNGLGVWGMLAIYGSLIISSFFLPTYIIRKLSAKWTLVVSMIGYTFYMAAQFYPSFSTIIPTAIILGICAAPLWTSESFYLTHIAGKYASLSGGNTDKPSEPTEVVIVKFFGIFFCLFQTSSIWGNLISSLVLGSGTGGGGNGSVVLRNVMDGKCGPDFCPSLDTPEVNPETGGDYGEDLKLKVDIFCGICLAIAFVGIAISAFFLDSLEIYGESERQSGKIIKDTGYDLLVSTFRQMRHPYQILMIPLTLFSGLQQSFFWSDYTQAYITCSWGVEHVGFVFILYGIVDSVGSLVFSGPVINKVGRGPIFMAGAVIKIVVIGIFYWWRPNGEGDRWVFFVIAGLWGAGDAVWSCQISAFYGHIFKGNEEAAFSNFQIWGSLGFMIGYANSIALCTRPKLWVLTVFLIVGVSCFFVIEVKEKRKKGKKGTKV